MKRLRTCVTPAGKFQYGIHKPSYSVTNLRQESRLATLGKSSDEQVVKNNRNYPENDINVDSADWIYEIPNAFPFKGCTYIDKEWADDCARNPERIRLKPSPEVSLTSSLKIGENSRNIWQQLPEPVLLALATCSTDARDLVALAEISCLFIKEKGRPTGLSFHKAPDGSLRPAINNHALYEAVANNPHLPDPYKIVMVIRPGAQGGSEIVGEWPQDGNTHVFEYLRRNSYIPGGHYAANMADDAIRYSIAALNGDDLHGLRHLYYQRTFVRLAQDLGLPQTAKRRNLLPEELETLRLAIAGVLEKKGGGITLWGWNFGFDFAPSHYRLHASHQQIHQQYAMIPENVASYTAGCEHPSGLMAAFACGDLLAEVIEDYRQSYDRDFFADYRAALAANTRMDGRSDLPADLVIWSDGKSTLFVPKAQTSQWELQLMTLPSTAGFLPGNIVECDTAARNSLDTGILKAQKALAGLGAKMVTSIEYAKRLGDKNNEQPLLYAFLPRLPESPGAFSEAQLRFINGHYPEDFAAACRRQLG